MAAHCFGRAAGVRLAHVCDSLGASNRYKFRESPRVRRLIGPKRAMRLLSILPALALSLVKWIVEMGIEAATVTSIGC